MLSLSVSEQPCAPGKAQTPAPGDRPRPTSCETCAAPGGSRGELLEKHIVGKKGHKYLCPLCHMCLHLDVAGRKRAGRIIWLPEMSQEELNVMCVAMFIAVERQSYFRDDPNVKAIADGAKRLYKAFERRSEAIESLLGMSSVKTLLPRQSLSSPVHIASLIVRTQRDLKLAPAQMAGRLKGMCMLPDPRGFEKYVLAASRLIGKQSPVNTWFELAAAAFARGTAADVPPAHFDAAAIAA